MKSAVPGDCCDDEIEVLTAEIDGWGCVGRIRIRERQGIGVPGFGKDPPFVKCNIWLTADQLEEHARECIAIAAKIRSRQ